MKQGHARAKLSERAMERERDYVCVFFLNGVPRCFLELVLKDELSSNKMLKTVGKHRKSMNTNRR